MKNKLSSKQIYATIILFIMFIIGTGLFIFIKHTDKSPYDKEISEESKELIQSQPENMVKANDAPTEITYGWPEYMIESDEGSEPYFDGEKVKQFGYAYIYSKSMKKWREYSFNDTLAPDDILVSKGSLGKCSLLLFSSYRYKYLNKFLELDQVTIFINNGNLYTFDYCNLRMNKVFFKDNRFQWKNLTINEIQKIYPYVKIIKVSEFKNGYLKVTQAKKSQTYLLLSDTDYSGYNYGVEGCNFKLKRDYDLAIFTINSDKAKVAHSFFGDCNLCTDERPCLIMDFDIVK